MADTSLQMKTTRTTESLLEAFRCLGFSAAKRGVLKASALDAEQEALGRKLRTVEFKAFIAGYDSAK